MPLFAETEDKIFGDILYDVVNNTNISRTSPGSKMRSLVEAVSKKMGIMYSQFDLNIGQAFLDGAEGKFLDFIGDMMGVERLGEEPARVSADDQNIRFRVDVGTFGDINGGSSILLTSGTIVSTAPDGGGIRYRVIANSILGVAEDEGFVSVESTKSGGAINIGSNQLIFHNFSNYTDKINDTLKVTNNADIANAHDVEIDSNYRFRIANQVTAAERANLIAIRLAALSVPGVADIIIIPFHRGIGTYDIMIKSTVPNISDTLTSTVQNVLDNVHAHGIVGVARGPVEVGISMVGTVSFKRRLADAEQSAILSTAIRNVTDYINALDIGEEFIVNEVIERVMSSSDLIKNLGQATRPLDSIFIYKPSRLEDNKIRSTLIGDFKPEVDERPLVENRFAGNTPILFKAS